MFESPKTVSPLRQDLRLITSANNHDGSPAWLIQDPIKNQFYKIGWLEFEILARWDLLLIESITNSINIETTLHASADDVIELQQFMQNNHLLDVHSSQAVQRLIDESNSNKANFLTALLHHYLVFRIPIIKPQKWLSLMLPYVNWLYGRQTLWVIIGLTLMGLLLALRQWDNFNSTFVDHLSFTGLISYGLALCVSKCLHEFGHAITATRYGVRVGHMGIVMLVMFPMPYTDTSESWKLPHPSQRLHIASAGILFELALAGIATFAWSITPEGSVKSALFFLATTSWVLTLAVNLSPFMKFDGYFILSDWLDFPNLHERSAALARTWLRRTLLGFDEPWPETLSSEKRRCLIAFAAMTWLYRITLFFGIAWLVYQFFFKALGIILFVVEIAWFVWLPIWRELKNWHFRSREIKKNRLYMGLTFAAALLIVALIPWQTTIHRHAWIYATNYTTIFSPTAGKLIYKTVEGKVAAGQTLFELTQPDVVLQAERAQAMASARSAEIVALGGQEDGESKRASLQFHQQKLQAEVKLYQDELARLKLIAPFNGELRDLEENLALNTWLHPEQPLAVLIDPHSWVVDAFVEEDDMSRIALGDGAVVYVQENSLIKMKGAIDAIEQNEIHSLPTPMLSAPHGGPFATLEADTSRPRAALYRVRIKLDAPPSQSRMALAKVAIQTQPRAWLPSVVKRIGALLVRESGF